MQILTHRVGRKGDRLQVTLEIPLAAVLQHLCPQADRLEDTLYRQLSSYLVRHVPDDIWDVAEILKSEGELGHVKWFNDKLGYGFIRTYNKEDVFVHQSQLVGEGYKSLEQGQRVQFKRRFVVREGREVIEAVDVTLIEKDK